jgi:sialic acid synthase SpsE
MPHDGNIILLLPDNEYKSYVLQDASKNHEILKRNIINFLFENNIFAKKSTIVDIGSNCGDNALPWAINLKKINGKIYAIDPSIDNLNYIKTLEKEFPGFLIGYSDHTNSDYSLTSIRVAHELGAKIIEKHFTHNKNKIGNDHYHAAEKKDFINFYKSLQVKNKLYGNLKKNLKKEKKSIKFARRSIFSQANIKKGEKLSPSKLITLRPGDGVSASFWDIVIKSTARINISKFKKIEWKDLIL